MGARKTGFRNNQKKTKAKDKIQTGLLSILWRKKETEILPQFTEVIPV